MKTFIALLCCTSIGCSWFQEKDINPNYKAYVEAMKVQAERTHPPVLDLQLTPDGKIASIKVSLPQENVKIQQQVIQYHPAWGIFGNVLSVVGGIWAAGDAIKGIVAAGSGPVIGSYNTSGDTTTATASGSYNVPTLTNTSTSTSMTTSTQDNHSLENSNNSTPSTVTTDPHNVE